MSHIMKAFQQHGYYVFLGVGAISMLILMLCRRQKYLLSIMQASLYTILLLICGITGAKLLFFIESGFSNFSGMSFYGAVYLVLILMPVVGFAFQMSPMESLNACAPCVASIIGFMRFGCWCAGCCGGWVMYVGSIYFTWPTQIMESIGDFIILAWLLRSESKKCEKTMLYPMFLIWYGILRFFVEFFRYIPEKWMGLGHGQWFSILAILIGFMCIKIENRKNNYPKVGGA